MMHLHRRICAILPFIEYNLILNCNNILSNRKLEATQTLIKSEDQSSIGKILSECGFTAPTPNFNTNFSKVSDLELESIKNENLSNVQLSDIEGPWLILSPDFQGELLIDKLGIVVFRPAGLLGQGIGCITIHNSSIGTSMFKLEIETYIFENTPTIPPHAPKKYNITGLIQEAVAAEYHYQTKVLSGTIQCADGNSGPFNAAKLVPWTPTTEEFWKPNPDFKVAFDLVFGHLPMQLDSHINRKEMNAEKNDSDSPVHLSLQKYAVGDVSGVYYIPNYISKDEQEMLLQHLAATPAEMKQVLKKRMCQEWGCSMCPTCNKSFVADYNLPPWAKGICDMLIYEGIFTPSTYPNSVRIHEYEVGQGIGPHCDGPIYVPKVAVLSLASTSVMHFYPKTEPHFNNPIEHYNDTFKFDEGEIGSNRPIQSVVMEPGSLLIFLGDGYVWHPHGVSDKEIDILDEEHAGTVVNRHFLSDPDMREVKRNYRVSLTIRNLLQRCSHVPQRSEYNMREAWSLYHQQATTSTDPFIEKEAAFTVQTVELPDAATLASKSGSEPQARKATLFELAEVKDEIEKIYIKQSEIESSINEIKELIVHTSMRTANFEKDVSQILDNVTSVVMEIKSNVDTVAEKMNIEKI